MAQTADTTTTQELKQEAAEKVALCERNIRRRRPGLTESQMADALRRQVRIGSQIKSPSHDAWIEAIEIRISELS